MSTDNLKRLFPRRKQQTTVERHKGNVNKEKTAQAEKKSRRKKLAMIERSKALLSQFDLHFDPVIIGGSLSPRKKADSATQEKRKSKGVKPRPLMKQVPASTARKPASGLKIKTLTASRAASSGKQRKQSRTGV